MIFRDIERLIQPQKVLDKVVFDLDALVKENGTESNTNLKEPINTKENLSRKGSTSSSSRLVSNNGLIITNRYL